MHTNYNVDFIIVSNTIGSVDYNDIKGSSQFKELTQKQVFKTPFTYCLK